MSQKMQQRDRELGVEIDNAFAEQLAAIDSRFLLAIIHGVTDLDGVARRLLADRGIDANGQWVGRVKAGKALLG